MPWLDGTLYEESTVPFDLADRGLLLGDGIFDTSLVIGGRMVWRTAHVARLVSSARSIGFAIEAGQIETAIDAVLGQTAEASLRITLTRGSGPRGLAPPVDPKPTLFAATAPLRKVAIFAPLKLHVSDIRRNDTSPASKIKTLGYLDGILATREALDAGCDDALFFNTKERLACTSVGNVFVLMEDQIVTPPLNDGVLPGIARDLILKSCSELGLEAVERSLTTKDIDRADAMVVTNSLRLIAPVIAIGRRQIGSSGNRRVQSLIAHVAELVRAETGVDPRLVAEA